MDIVPFDHVVKDLRISGNGSKVFLLNQQLIHAWSIQTGKAVGNVRLEQVPRRGSLIMDGSRAWVYFSVTNKMGGVQNPRLRSSHSII